MPPLLHSIPCVDHKRSLIRGNQGSCPSLQERAALEEHWQREVSQAKAAAERSKQATEAKVGSIINRLHSLAEKENKRETQRGEGLLSV